MKSPVIPVITSLADAKRAFDNLRNFFAGADKEGGVSSGNGAGVTSFNKRFGTVLPKKGDYQMKDIDGILPHSQLPALLGSDIPDNSANAGSADRLTTPRLINGQAFDGSADITITTATTGLTVIVNTSPLTVGGVAGSMTFTNGILTAQVQAT